MMGVGFVTYWNLWELTPAFPEGRIELSISNTTPSFTRSATKLSGLFAESKTGAEWRPAMTAARRCSSQLVLSLQSLCFGCDFYESLP